MRLETQPPRGGSPFRVSAPTVGLVASGLPEIRERPINNSATYPIDIIFLKSSKMAQEAALCDEVKCIQLIFYDGRNRGEVYKYSLMPGLAKREMQVV